MANPSGMNQTNRRNRDFVNALDVSAVISYSNDDGNGGLQSIAVEVNYSGEPAAQQRPRFHQGRNCI